jgi:hypothetical protein
MLKKLLIILEVGLVAYAYCVLLQPITFAGAVVGVVNVSVAASWKPMKAPSWEG